MQLQTLVTVAILYIIFWRTKQVLISFRHWSQYSPKDTLRIEFMSVRPRFCNPFQVYP